MNDQLLTPFMGRARQIRETYQDALYRLECEINNVVPANGGYWCIGFHGDKPEIEWRKGNEDSKWFYPREEK